MVLTEDLHHGHQERIADLFDAGTLSGSTSDEDIARAVGAKPDSIGRAIPNIGFTLVRRRCLETKTIPVRWGPPAVTAWSTTQGVRRRSRASRSRPPCIWWSTSAARRAPGGPGAHRLVGAVRHNPREAGRRRVTGVAPSPRGAPVPESSVQRVRPVAPRGQGSAPISPHSGAGPTRAGPRRGWAVCPTHRTARTGRYGLRLMSMVASGAVLEGLGGPPYQSHR